MTELPLQHQNFGTVRVPAHLKQGMVGVLTAVLTLIVSASWLDAASASAGGHAAHRVCGKRSDGRWCSSGLLKGYVGPIDTAAQVKEAFAATAHQGEIIIFSESGRISEASQTLARFRNAGYSHIMALLQEAHVCSRLVHIFQPFVKVHGPISCGTYAGEDASGKKYPVGFQYLNRGIARVSYWMKWFTAARAVALGYNVMAVDQDTLILDDFYFRVKAPSPLAKYNMFTQGEGLTLINSGFTYVQNAASNGPIAWMLYDMVQKIVRWSEDPSELFKMAPKAGEANSIWGDDQESMSDVLWSCVAGKPRFYILGYNIRNDEAAWQKLGVKNFREHAERINPKEKWTLETYPVSGDFAKVVCEHLPYTDRCSLEPATNMSVQTVVLHMPHSGGEWPLELGGYPFNRTLGPLTLAYRQSFKDLGVPLPPDPEDPATEAAARATKPELFTLMQTAFNTKLRFQDYNPMSWVESVWTHNGRHGLWHIHLFKDGSIHQGAGHVFAGLYPSSIETKFLVLQVSGHWDWRIAARVAGSPDKVYHASAGEGDLRRVVAYAPGVIHSELTKDQFVAAVQGLAQVAVAIGAVAGWPDTPCDVEWAQRPAYRNQSRKGIVQTIPWVNIDTNFQVYPFGDSLENLKCNWNGFAWAECLANRRPNGIDTGRGLMPLEFAHLLQRTRHELQATMGQDAEIHIGTPLVLAKSGPAVAPLAPGGSTFFDVSYDELLSVNTDTLLHGHSHEHVPILWVDRLVGNVTSMSPTVSQVYANWKSVCKALRYNELTFEQRHDW